MSVRTPHTKPLVKPASTPRFIPPVAANSMHPLPARATDVACPPDPLPGAASLRVVKRLLPNQRGAVALTRQHGHALICVRHRQDAAGAFRYTTVELLVECRAIAARNTQAVGVRIDFRETRLRTQIRAQGGRWDPQHQLWTVSRKVVAHLGLQSRVVMTY